MRQGRLWWRLAICVLILGAIWLERKVRAYREEGQDSERARYLMEQVEGGKERVTEWDATKWAEGENKG